LTQTPLQPPARRRWLSRALSSAHREH
jgi:hypothetical protein